MITPLEEHEKSGEQLRVKLNEVILELEAITRFLEQKEQHEKAQGQTVQTTTYQPTMRTPNEAPQPPEGTVLEARESGMLKVKRRRGAELMTLEQYTYEYPTEAAEYLNHKKGADYEEADQTEAEVHEEE